MFEQYLRIKEGYPDALLFYRMGDFYELFFEDAEVASRELQIALTSRNPNAEAPIPMCGVPWHAAEGYVSQLLNKGYKIAFCDQVEDPRAAKGLVERAVTRVYTPGTAVEDVSLEPKGHTYLGALFWSADTDRGGFAWVDVSTGYWAGLHVKKSQELWQWAQKIAPRELLLPEDADVPASLHLTDIQAVRVPLRSHFDYKRSAERVLAAQSVAELGALGLEGRKELVQACGALLAYLEQTQMQDTKHLAPFEPLDLGQHLLIDDVTERNLELFRRLDGRKGVGTLRHVIDSTQTPMGGRLLEERLRNPWRELAPIQETQDAIAWLITHPENRKKLRETLSGVYDLERLSTRIALNRTSPRDMLSLRQSLAALPPVKSAITSSDADTPRVLRSITEHWDDLGDHAATLQKALADDPPQFITEGGLFKQGYNAELDELLDLVEHGENRVGQRSSTRSRKPRASASSSLATTGSSATTSSCPKPLAARLPSILSADVARQRRTFHDRPPQGAGRKTAFRRRPAQISGIQIVPAASRGTGGSPPPHPVHGRHAGAAGLLAVAGGNGGAPQLVAPRAPYRAIHHDQRRTSPCRRGHHRGSRVHAQRSSYG